MVFSVVQWDAEDCVRIVREAQPAPSGDEDSLRSWQYCKRPRNKVLDKRAAKPRGEWGEGL